jgi:phi13 family phage major tail protein
MATIGLDKLYYSKITEDSEGSETYGLPQTLAKAINAELNVEITEEVLHADDGPAFVIKEFAGGTLQLGTADLPLQAIADLTGAVIDENGALVSSSEDGGQTVAIGFRAKRPEGNYRYIWIYKIKFGAPSIALETKGKSVSFKTPTIQGAIMRRNKPDSNGKHPWMVEVIEGNPGVPASTIASWFSAVYEEQFPTEA